MLMIVMMHSLSITSCVTVTSCRVVLWSFVSGILNNRSVVSSSFVSLEGQTWFVMLAGCLVCDAMDIICSWAFFISLTLIGFGFNYLLSVAMMLALCWACRHALVSLLFSQCCALRICKMDDLCYHGYK